MPGITPSPSFLSFRSAPLGYRIRTRQIDAAAEEVEMIVTTNPESSILNEDLAPGVEALTSLVGNFDEQWKILLQTLEQTGLPGLVLDPVLSAASEFVASSRRFVALLRQHTDAYSEQLAKVVSILDRIEPQIQALRSTSGEAPPIDAARLERGAQEMEQGQGIDAEELLQKYQSSGEL